MSDHACCWHSFDDVRQEKINAVIAYCCRRECKNVKILFGYKGMEEKSHGFVLSSVPTLTIKQKISSERACGACGITESKAPFGPGGTDGARLFVRTQAPDLVCYPCLEKIWWRSPVPPARESEERT